MREKMDAILDKAGRRVGSVDSKRTKIFEKAAGSQKVLPDSQNGTQAGGKLEKSEHTGS